MELGDLIGATLRLGGPLVLAALAGVISERSGVINIALEGNLLGAACAGSLVSAATGNPVLGLGAGILAAVFLSLLHGLGVLIFRIDHIVSGMAVNAISFGLTGFAIKVAVMKDYSVAFQSLPEAFFIVIVFVAVVGIWGWLRFTTPGLHILAVGNDGRKAMEMGVNPVGVRFKSQVAVGVLCGLGGVMLVSQPEQFSSGMTAGRGFIALAAVILGGWWPLKAAIAALGFGLFDALQLRLQGVPIFGVMFPSEFWASLPYLLTIIALGGLLGRSRPPAALGK
jgi:ABC-type uncharacterized transport system permease subunit